MARAARPIAEIMRDARPSRPLPVIEAKPLKQNDLFGGGLYGSGTLDPTRTGTDPSVISHLQGQLRPFDPSRVETAINLAAAFVPGPGKSGKFTGVSPKGREFLEQLRTHDFLSGKNLAGDDVRSAYFPKPASENPIPHYVTDPMSKGFDPEIFQIAMKLGYTRGKPFSELQEQIAKRTPPGYDPAHFVSTVLGTATRNPGSSTLGGELSEVRAAAVREMTPERRAQFFELIKSKLPWRNKAAMNMLDEEIARLKQTSGLAPMHDSHVANQVSDVIWNLFRHN